MYIAGACTYIISDAATSDEGEEAKVLAVGDMTCAFLHASMEDEPPLYLIFPAGLAPTGARGRLRKALYGTRRASLLWGEEVAGKMVKRGFRRLRGCPQGYHHRAKKIKSIVHGDDFFSSLVKSAVSWLSSTLGVDFKFNLKTLKI